MEEPRHTIPNDGTTVPSAYLRGQSYHNISQVEIQLPLGPLKCDVKHRLHNVTRFNGEAERQREQQTGSADC
jgi:hypothetical protein